MIGFIEKNRLYIGITLVLIILFGCGILLWQKQIGSAWFSEKEIELANLRRENQELRNKLAELEKQNSNTGEVKSAVSQEPEGEYAKINLNTADARTLETLPGIGPTRAQQIIDYRKRNGGFKTISEIKNIKGIGPKTFEKLKDMITVD